MANSECLNIVLLVRMLEVTETKAGRLRMTNFLHPIGGKGSLLTLCWESCNKIFDCCFVRKPKHSNKHHY